LNVDVIECIFQLAPVPLQDRPVTLADSII